MRGPAPIGQSRDAMTYSYTALFDGIADWLKKDPRKCVIETKDVMRVATPDGSKFAYVCVAAATELGYMESRRLGFA